MYANRVSKKEMDEIRNNNIKVFGISILDKMKNKILNFFRK